MDHGMQRRDYGGRCLWLPGTSVWSFCSTSFNCVLHWAMDICRRPARVATHINPHYCPHEEIPKKSDAMPCSVVLRPFDGALSYTNLVNWIQLGFHPLLHDTLTRQEI